MNFLSKSKETLIGEISAAAKALLQICAKAISTYRIKGRMSSRDRLASNRLLELFLFSGVPENPESTFERDTYANIDGRVTGRTVGVSDSNNDDEETDGRLLGYLEIDLDSQTGKFIVEDEQ